MKITQLTICTKKVNEDGGFHERKSVEQQDKQYVWHPFTQMQGWLENQQTVICEAKGIKLTDTEGRSYYDGVSSLWVNIQVTKRREIDEAIIAQLGKVAHSTALGLANIPAAELVEQLVARAPDGLEKASIRMTALRPLKWL